MGIWGERLPSNNQIIFHSPSLFFFLNTYELKTNNKMC